MKWFKRIKPPKENAGPTAVEAVEPAAGAGRAPGFRWPVISIDLGQPRHRRNLFLLGLALMALAAGFLYAGYETYHYTESIEFCGTACHPMAPQYARFEKSTHANVECVKCHIGPGTDFFVRSKIDGLRQVVAVMANTYHRPITTPVHNLRPAREICEACHSPATFKDNIVKSILHFDNDEANTPVQTTLILKMGGFQANKGIGEGIHWHVTSEVYYIAADEQRQVMLWVGVKQPDGSLKEYFSRDLLSMAQTAFVEKARAEGKIRRLDCIDCHNRTAHLIPTPEDAVDSAIRDGLISRDIPYIRKNAVEILKGSYETQAEAYAAIEALAGFYQARSATGGASSEPLDEHVAQAVNELKRIYAATNFPDMRLDWKTNPNNERHTASPGCFRCHDNAHVALDASGKEETISVDCKTCHTVPIVGRGQTLLVEAPIIIGPIPQTHASFKWTVEHRSITADERQTCLNCHGLGFCNNGICHNLDHPIDMVYGHAAELRKTSEQACYICHQNVTCARCHPSGIVKNP